jgi:hypothetical protein
MEVVGRDPAKQSRVEDTLRSIKGSRAYGDIEEKIRSGIYRTNRSVKNKNRNSLEKKKLQLSRKLERGESRQIRGNTAKMEKIGTLLSIIHEETNVENANNDGNNKYVPAEPPPEVNRENLEGIPPLPVAAEEVDEFPIEPLNKDEFGTAVPAAAEPAPTKKFTIRKRLNNALNFAAAAAVVPESQTTTVSNIQDPLLNNSREEPAEDIGEKKPLNEDVKGSCHLLFDPCTGTPLEPNTLQALEKRIREIKKQMDTIPVGLYGLTNDTSNYDFLTKVFIDPKVSLNDMVSFRLSAGGQVGSDIYEVLSRLFVFFGGIENVNPRKDGNYKFMKKIEGDAPEVYDDSVEALKKMKCKATRAMGISDITLTNVRNDKQVIKPNDPYCEVECDTKDSDNTRTYLISVKWYKDEKNAEHYDLEKLFTAAEKITTAEQRPLDIIVFLKSKRDFEIAHNRSFRQYTRDIAKTFFGWDEDVKPFLEEKRRAIFDLANLTSKTPLESLGLQYFQSNAKPFLSLQLHQDIIVKGVCDRIEISDNNRYLIGVLPRGGKTFIAGGIIREYLRRAGIPNLNIFWLTAAPTETMTQVRDELLDKFRDFTDFEFIEVKAVSDIKKTKLHSVFFCSTQLLIASQKQASKQREYLQSLLKGKDSIGLIFFDEAHKTGTGDKTKLEIQSIMDTYNHLKLPFIFLTATYYNILSDYQIQKENTFIWDYTDVLLSRSLATESEKENAMSNLQERFGKVLVDTIVERRIGTSETLETMAKAYIGFPDLFFISADFQEEALRRFTEQGKYRPDSGFSLSAIFALKQVISIVDIKTADNKVRRDAYKIFENLTNPKNIISLITPRETFDSENPDISAVPGGEPLSKEEKSVIEPSLLGRINKMSSEAKSRFRLDEQPTMLMFMPTGGPGTNIFYLLCAWGTLLMTHKWWRDNYEVACVVSEENIGEAVGEVVHVDLASSDGVHIISKNPKASILTLERKLHCEKSKGLLILAGEKLSMGISLPCTDVVFLFNEKKSPDDIIQKMYRALTPSPGKKSAFIVDLNPVRTLAALHGYTRISHESSNTNSQILDIIYDTYSWDSDIFEYNLMKGTEARPLSFHDRLRQLFEMAEKDPLNEYGINKNIRGFEKKLGNSIRRGMNSEFLSKLAGQFSSKKLESTLGSIGLKEGSKVTLQKGTLIIRTPRERVAGEPNGEPLPSENIEIVIDNFIETVADFVKYLAITSAASTLDGALEEYESRVTNQEGTSLRQNVIHLVPSRTEIKEGQDKELLSKLLITATKDFDYNSSKEVFRQMKGQIEEKSLRKDKVLAIIHKRLTPRKKQKDEKGEVFTPIEIVEEMLSRLPKSVWSNPDLKWLDPANGIGNFPVVVFYRLNEGLKSWEPNDNKRRKHIVEKMLFMLELESNNTRIARNIFEKLCDNCKPNILTTDSLKITADGLSKKGFPEKYDIIIGNPPFNAGGTLKGGGTIWPKFVKRAFELVKENGYICFVHPPGWRKFYDPEDRDNQGKLWHTIRENGWNLDYVNVSDQPPKHFPIVDYYIIHAKKTNKPTKYDSKFMGITDSGESTLDYPFIPNMLNDETIGILKKMFDAKGEPIHIIRNQSFQPSKADEGKSGTPHYHFTDKGGKKHIYNKQYATIPEYINKDKVLLTFSNGYEKGKLFAFYSNEKYGTTGSTMYMLTTSKAQGDKLVKFFNSDIVTFLMKITQYSASPNHKNEFKILNQLEVPDSLDYGLTPKEEALIKKVLGAKEDVEAEEAAEGGGAKRRNFTRKVRRT